MTPTALVLSLERPPFAGTAFDATRLRARHPDWEIGICVACRGPAVFGVGHDPYHVTCDPRAVTP